MIRNERGISGRELADAVGVHYQTIGYIERGDHSPSLDLALPFSRHFDLPVEALFSLDPFRLWNLARTHPWLIRSRFPVP